jgi:glucose/arabinose dehydrogenase
MRPIRRAARVALVVVVPFAATTAHAQTMSDPDLLVSNVVPQGSGLSLPTAMAFVGPRDLLVLEKQTGRVRRVLDDVLLPAPLLDLDVNFESERGLLGIATSHGTPIRVYLYFTEADGMDGGPALGNRVRRYDWLPEFGQLLNGVTIADLPVTPGPNHNGGALAVDHQGRLYVSVGCLNRDGQLQNDPAGAPPDDTSVVLRLDADGAPAAGNPFTPYCSVTTATICAGDGDCPASESCRLEVAKYFAYGLRNSFGMTFDPARTLPRLWLTENGTNAYDELDLVDAGMNGGWSRILGPDARDPQSPDDLFDVPGAGSTYSDPEFSWLPQIVPTGVAVPYGSSWGPAYDGVVVVGNQLGALFALPLAAHREALELSAIPQLSDLVADNLEEANLVRIGQQFGVVVDLETGPDGALYVLDIAGSIRRIEGPRADLFVFLDGFESGNAEQWSSTTATRPVLERRP